MAAKKDPAKIKAMKKYISSGDELVKESLVNPKKGTVRYPIYEVSENGEDFVPVTGDNKRLSFITTAKGYNNFLDNEPEARQYEAVKGLEDGKTIYRPGITVFLVHPEGRFKSEFGVGDFVNLPREMISDVHWDEFAMPLTTKGEKEQYIRSIQRAEKTEPKFELVAVDNTPGFDAKAPKKKSASKVQKAALAKLMQKKK
jgi:hypothetical protein